MYAVCAQKYVVCSPKHAFEAQSLFEHFFNKNNPSTIALAFYVSRGMHNGYE